MAIEFVPLKPRIYINSFPKSGTNLAKLMTLHMAKRQEPLHWLGSFKYHSWTTEWIPSEKLISVIEGQPEGTWMMGHMGYKPELERAFQRMNTCMIFIYRDLRDVAVSQTYHIENEDDDRFKHLDKKLYMDLPTHEDRIQAVIEGIDKYAGIVERWELYAEWINIPWVFPVKYEEIQADPKEVSSKVVDYVIGRTLKSKDGFTFLLGEEYKKSIKKSLDLAQTTEFSGSFRKGKIGEWEKEFTQSNLKAFEETGGNIWLERLGYA